MGHMSLIQSQEEEESYKQSKVPEIFHSPVTVIEKDIDRVQINNVDSNHPEF